MIQILTAILVIFALFLYFQYSLLSTSQDQILALEQKVQTLAKAVQELQEMRVKTSNELSNNIEGAKGSIAELRKEVERFIKESQHSKKLDAHEKSVLFRSVDYLFATHDYLPEIIDEPLTATMDNGTVEYVEYECGQENTALEAERVT